MKDSNYYGVPPIQYQHSKEALIHYLGDSLAKSYKRKKLKLSVENHSSTDINETDDMDIESDNEIQSPASPSNQQSNQDAEENSNQTKASNGKDCDELSLNDLEKQKLELLEALNEANSKNGNPTVDENSNEDETSETSRSNTPVIGISKSTLTGTPLIKSISPFCKLPDENKWSTGVSEVIDFENLPDATGAYKKLSSVINKVRNVVKQINDQNDAEDDDL